MANATQAAVADFEPQKDAIKKEMMLMLSEKLAEEGWAQSMAAKVLKTTQSRISHLVNGRTDQFSLDKLIELALLLGVSMNFSIEPSRNEVKIKKI